MRKVDHENSKKRAARANRRRFRHRRPLQRIEARAKSAKVSPAIPAQVPLAEVIAASRKKPLSFRGLVAALGFGNE